MNPVERIVFIGAGQMAEALVRGLLAAGRQPDHLHVTDVAPVRLEHFHTQYGVVGSSDNAAAAREADVVVLAVKPLHMKTACEQIAGALTRAPLVISIAAGVPTERVETWLGGGARVVRAMPNTPARVGAGVTALAPGRLATETDLTRATRLFTAVGLVVRVSEPEMDAVTAISGSGPAYVFYLAEAMLEAAARLGLAPDIAETLVRQTILGAGRLMETESATSPTELRRRVTSKGGTTEAAVSILEARGVHDAWLMAIDAAAARARELSKLV